MAQRFPSTGVLDILDPLRTPIDITISPILVHPPAKQEFCWLIECFSAPGGVSRGLYWAGRSNRVELRHGSIEITTSPFKARRIPLNCDELAHDIAAALNKLRDETNTDCWSAIQHGFSG